MDKFEDFENKLVEWISIHKLGLLVMSFPIVLWIILSIAVVTMSGILGFTLVEINITEQYAAGVGDWTPESYAIWENWMVPVVVQMFNTLGYLMFAIVAIYGILLVYFTSRRIIRVRSQ
jgi:hypothetical protein